MTMINSQTWHNNRISKKLNEEYKRDFSICDIDGLVRCHYKKDKLWHTRLIIYESKNIYEKQIGDSQKASLLLLEKSIDWKQFDFYSGVYLIKIIDLDKKLEWYTLEGELKRTTDFLQLYQIFSAKIF